MQSALAFSRIVCSSLVSLLVGLSLAPTTIAANIDQQREIYLRVFADVERGNWDVVEALKPDEQAALRQYVLWPDLRATWFRATIRTADHAEDL